MVLSPQPKNDASSAVTPQLDTEIGEGPVVTPQLDLEIGEGPTVTPHVENHDGVCTKLGVD